VEFRSVFRAPSRKFKILAIPNILAHGKSYEHGFMKKCDGHKLCAMSRFDRFFMHRLRNSKYWSFPIYSSMGSHTSMILRKITTVINFMQSHVPSQVSISFVHDLRNSKYWPFQCT
ncbi:hypothetical protein GW17_00060509, partial [Ensete ventricosum]